MTSRESEGDMYTERESLGDEGVNGVKVELQEHRKGDSLGESGRLY